MPLPAPRTLALTLAALATACACPGGRTISLDDGTTICAEVADTEAARRDGLRGRDPLAPDEGLLLAFSVEDELCIVNDGVAFPIDAAWANADGVVIAIERDVPAGDPTVRCHGPARYVLETAAGALDDLEVGWRLRW